MGISDWSSDVCPSELQAGSDKLLAAESAENLKLSDYLLRATERLNRLNQQHLQTRQQLDTLNQTAQALEAQIAVLEGRLLLSRTLRSEERRAGQEGVGTRRSLCQTYP